MRIPVTRARLAVALIGPAVAVGLSFGAGQAQASTGAPASGVTWHKLFAINGWATASQVEYGAPSWAVKGGVVYLSGAVSRAGGSSRLFAVLPPQARPAHKMWITVYTVNDSTGTVAIDTNGKMSAYSTPAGDSAGFTSLAGVSFPARSMAQHKVSLLNGWHSEQSAWSSGDPSYVVSGGVVYLSGSLATSGSSDHFATLPRAARPKSVEYITVYTYDDTFGTVQIDPNGTASAYSGSADSFTSLAGVSYPVASAASHKIPLQSGWHSEQGVWGSGDPAYAVSGGVVHLSGSLATSGSNDFCGTLPAGARPRHYLYLKVYTYGSTVGTLQIDPDGAMFAYGPVFSKAAKFTSLAAISYPASS